MDSKTLDQLISTRGRIKISHRNGWAAGVTGIALGFNTLYGNVKIGFIDDNGDYTGEYTKVSLSMVEVATTPDDMDEYCGIMHTETGYKCTLSGEHTEHVAQGLNNEVIYTWPVADDALGTDKPMPGTIEPATTTLGKPVTDFQVKVWYASGSAETVSHIDFLAAASIYSEAQGNVRVVAAEVHCPGGCLAARFMREGKCPDPELCARMGDKGGRCRACCPADGLDSTGERG